MTTHLKAIRHVQTTKYVCIKIKRLFSNSRYSVTDFVWVYYFCDTSTLTLGFTKPLSLERDNNQELS